MNMFLLIVFSSHFIFAQTTADKIDVQSKSSYNKGDIFAFWGWNRSFYGVSDIHFKGADYNFVLHNVVAHDRPTPFGITPYFHPLKITIPQTNMKLGYFIKDDLSLILSVDHMKYVMYQNQTAEYSGEILNPVYSSKIEQGKVDLTDKKFLTFEHTDGLNYINIGVEKNQSLYGINYFNINWSYGVGGGFLLPKSNIKLFDNDRSDRFNFAGFGLDMRTNLNLVFWKHVILSTEFKAGYINMPRIMTTLRNKLNTASQDFIFMQFNFGIAYVFKPNKTKK